MKLALVTPWTTQQGGGVAEAARLQARLLAAEPGIEVEVLSVREHGQHRDLEDWGKATIESFVYLGPSNYRFSPGLFMRILRSDADLMHVHGIWTFQCLAVLVWSLLTRRPYVVSPHGMLEPWILRRSPVLKAMVQGLYQRRFLRRAAAVQVLTDKERAEAEAFAAGRMVAVPNFVEASGAVVGPPAWLTDELRARTIYLYFGRIHEKKGWRQLCDGWDRACRDAAFRSASQLVFCGWIDAVPDFEAMVGQLAARHGNVLFAGPQFGADRAASLQAADVLVLPSLSEGQPMVVLEAWAAGKPVLMTAACNLPVGFDRGAAMEIGAEPEAIEIGLRAFSAMPETDRAAMGQTGRRLVADTFSPERVRRQLLEVYELIIGDGAT